MTQLNFSSKVPCLISFKNVNLEDFNRKNNFINRFRRPQNIYIQRLSYYSALYSMKLTVCITGTLCLWRARVTHSAPGPFIQLRLIQKPLWQYHSSLDEVSCVICSAKASESENFETVFLNYSCIRTTIAFESFCF